jgi:KipI family sensor histidine kinase inhibitor
VLSHIWWRKPIRLPIGSIIKARSQGRSLFIPLASACEGSMAQRISALGDSAVLVHFGDDIDLAVNNRVHALDARLRVNLPTGVIELVPAYATLLIHYDPLLLSFQEINEWLRAELDKPEEALDRRPRHIEVPVQYGGASGPDLPRVASFHHISAAEVVRLHTAREYTVFMMGFTPGFPYMGKLDDGIATPRLETPRPRVAAGSVGIAGAQTGIYPIDSPGGWQIIGRTSLNLFDPFAEDPFLFSPGDTVRFIAEGLDA